MNTSNNTTIETVSGLLVDLANPRPEDFKAEDIAWGLSREPRFGGHTITEIVYSVGQHSIQVAKILQAIWVDGPIRDAFLSHEISLSDRTRNFIVKNKTCPKWLMLWGLLHDASEAYLRDLPSPVKNLPGLREAYLAVERQIMDIILAKYNVYERLPGASGAHKLPDGCDGQDIQAAGAMVHWADIYARTIEAYHFMPSRGAFWPAGARHENVSLVDLQNFELPKKSIVVYEEFLMWLDELST